MGQIGSDEEKSVDEFFLLLSRVKHPDFVSQEDPQEQIKVACHLVKVLEGLPLTSFQWNDEDFAVSCFIVWFDCSADFLGH